MLQGWLHPCYGGPMVPALRSTEVFHQSCFSLETVFSSISSLSLSDPVALIDSLPCIIDIFILTKILNLLFTIQLKVLNIIQIWIKIRIQFKTQGNAGHTWSLPQDAWDWRVYWGARRVWPFMQFDHYNVLNNFKLQQFIIDAGV